MSTPRKLIIATALLAVGYTVASFLGSPSAPHLAPSTRASLEHHARTWRDPTVHSRDNDSEPLAQARLLPEIASNRPLVNAVTVLATDEPSRLIASERNDELASTPLTTPPPASFATAVDAEPLYPVASSTSASTRADQSPAHGIKAPDIVEAAQIQSEQKQDQFADRAGHFGGNLIGARWNPPVSAGSGSGGTTTTIGSTPVLKPKDVEPVSYVPIATSSDISTSAPVEWTVSHRPAPPTRLPPIGLPASNANLDALRAHIVVDGDSLERLATRYLHDAARGDEIFELNRERLQNPDLLPIGVELRIPSREDREPKQLAAEPSAIPISTTAAFDQSGIGALPIQPIRAPTDADVVPRAQLLRPIAAGWQQGATE